MHKYNEKILDDIANFLKDLKGKNIEFSIIPPHIEEIYGTLDGESYGRMEMDIHIEFEDLYKRVNGITGQWEKISKE